MICEPNMNEYKKSDFHVVEVKIHEQYIDEWRYPHNKYRIIDPKYNLMEERI